jgi:hypothetical protein
MDRYVPGHEVAALQPAARGRRLVTIHEGTANIENLHRTKARVGCELAQSRYSFDSANGPGAPGGGGGMSVRRAARRDATDDGPAWYH